MKNFIKKVIKNWLLKHPSYCPEMDVEPPMGMLLGKNVRLCAVFEIPRDIYERYSEQEKEDVVRSNLVRTITCDDDFKRVMLVERINSYSDRMICFRGSFYISVFNE